MFQSPHENTKCYIVCVCVNHLKRCKTSTFRSRLHVLNIHFLYLSVVHFLHLPITSRGMERTYEAPSNEAPHMILGYHQGRLVTYLQHHFSFRQWRPAKPSTGMSFSNCFRTQQLYGFHNLIFCRSRQEGTVVLSCIRT